MNIESSRLVTNNEAFAMLADSDKWAAYLQENHYVSAKPTDATLVKSLAKFNFSRDELYALINLPRQRLELCDVYLAVPGLARKLSKPQIESVFLTLTGRKK